MLCSLRSLFGEENRLFWADKLSNSQISRVMKRETSRELGGAGQSLLQH